jgi:hypothetical protein
VPQQLIGGEAKEPLKSFYIKASHGYFGILIGAFSDHLHISLREFGAKALASWRNTSMRRCIQHKNLMISAKTSG